MDRNSQRRISKIESLLAVAQKNREEKRKKLREIYVLHARYHATAVAAIVLSGQPRVDEPLNLAWARALEHYNISVKVTRSLNEQVRVAQWLFSRIIEGKQELQRFSEILSTAPAWLLKFTSVFYDAALLQFDLRYTSEVLKWGTAGYEESRRWPLLPSGTIKAGDPVSDEKARLWPFPLDMTEKAEPTPELENDRSREEDFNSSAGSDLVHDWNLALDLEEHPEMENELSRYQKLRLRNLFEHFSNK
jgi:hypothetical protein